MLAAFILGGCSSDDDMADLLAGDDPPAAAQTQQTPSAPLLLAQVDGGAPARMALRSSAPGPGAGTQTWVAGRFALIVANGRIIAAAGRGLTLSGTQFTDPDPLMAPLEIPDAGANWRRGVDLTDGDERRFGVALSCRIAPQGAQQITIQQTPHQVVRFREVCRGGGISTESYFWADVRTGVIWRSTQWAGEGVVTAEVVKPAD